MADVSDRGQMLLVAAFSIAVMLVALALVLNTAIYTENVATRGSDISGGKDAARYRAVTNDSVTGTIEYVNYNNNTSYTDLEDPLEAGVENFSNITARQQALEGIVTTVSMDRSSRGTRVYQHSDRNFSNEADAADWTVAENTAGVRNFTVNASKSSLTDATIGSLTGDQFVVNFSDADDGDWYRVYVYNNSGVTGPHEVAVELEASDGYTDSCSETYGDGRADINLTAGTVEGKDCAALQFFGNLSGGAFHVHFNNTCTGLNADCTDLGDEYTIKGTYSLVVNVTRSTVDGVGAGAPAPRKTYAIYSASVDLTYESKRILYETRLRVAPGEPDGYSP